MNNNSIFITGKNLLLSSLFIFLLFISIFRLVFSVKESIKTDISRASLEGDCNANGSVDILDFQLLSNSFGRTSGQTGYDGRCDFNNSNSIDILDFQILSNNFGRTGTESPAPSAPILTPTITPNSLIVSGVIYNSDSSANFNRNDRSSAELPLNLLNPNQGWVAVRIKMGFSAETNLSSDPIIWDMSESDPKALFLYYDVDSNRFHFGRMGIGEYSPVQTFTSGTYKTLIAKWTLATGTALSIDGSPFITNTNSGQIPAQSPFYIGSSARQGSGRQPNSDFYWVAGGTGTLTNSDALFIHSFGNSDKPRNYFPGNAVFQWSANSNNYNEL